MPAPMNSKLRTICRNTVTAFKSRRITTTLKLIARSFQYIGITSGRIDCLLVAVALDTAALFLELLS